MSVTGKASESTNNDPLQLALGSAGVSPFVDDYAEIVESFDDGLEVAAYDVAVRAGGVMSFFHGDDAAVRPGTLGNGVKSCWEVHGANFEVAAARSDGPQHASLPDGAGVGVGEKDVEGDHVALNSEVGVFPCVETVDGGVACFRWWREESELLAGGVKGRTLLRGEIGGGG